MDKQIDEIKKDIAVRMEMAKGIVGSMNNGVEGWLAEYLIEKGWEKINEGAVVLTDEEYDGLKIAKSFDYGYHEGESNTTAYYENIRLPEVRKETAEKFAERVKMAFYYEFDEIIPSIMADKIDEIAKEITEGK